MKFGDIVKSLKGKEVIVYYCVSTEDNISHELNISGTLKDVDGDSLSLEYKRKDHKHIFHLNGTVCVVSGIEEVIEESKPE